MSIHILIGYVANMMRHMNKLGMSKININFNYFTQNEKYAVRELVVHCPKGELSKGFCPKSFLAECHLPHFLISNYPNKIIITPLNNITFFSFQQEVFHGLKLRLFDINTPIFINNMLVSTNIQSTEWTFQDKYAYYLISSVFDQSSLYVKDKRQHYFKELDYHLDKLVICNGVNRPDVMDIKVYGFSGVIVPKKTLLVKNDNLLNKKDCPTWLNINSKLSSVLLKKINAWQRNRKENHSVLNRINRTILFNELTPMQLTSFQLLAVMDAPLFNTANGSTLNLLNLLKPTKINLYLDDSKWADRNDNEINYRINCANFFGSSTSNKNNYFVRLLNSPQHQVAIFLELIEKYVNTISGCYKYKTAFLGENLKHLENQRKAFQKNIKLTQKVQWVFHAKDGDVIYEFGFSGLNRTFKKTKKIELAA